MAKPRRPEAEAVILAAAFSKSYHVQSGAGSASPSDLNSLRLYHIDMTL